jgi:hypothetical protein
MRSRAIRDLGNVNHAVIEAIADGDIVFVINSDAEFDLDLAFHPELASLGFSKIKTGVTMANTGTSGVTSTSHRFWGTASNSIKLNGFADTEFVKAASAQFTAVAKFADAGLTIGASDDLGIFVDVDGVTPVIKNLLSDTIKFQTTSAGTKTPLTLVGNNILPGADIQSDIGSTMLKYNTVYASTFSGTATQANTMNVGGIYRGASTAASINTVAARDSAGDIYAILFQGTATRARFADLAEKYLADQDYEVGTVVVIGGEKEVTACAPGQLAIGVVSANPAHLMNSELEGGTAIALKGRVPVKVTGSVIKGQRLVAGPNGTAQSAMGNTADVFAVALESSIDVTVKSVAV